MTTKEDLFKIYQMYRLNWVDYFAWKVVKRKLSRVDSLQARKPWYLRTLFRIKGVESSGSYLSIIGSESPPLPIDQLSDFLKYKPRPWGGTISIQGTRIKNIGFLKKVEAQRFVSISISLLRPHREQIACHARNFKRLAEDAYLRDSSIEKLEDSTEEWLLRYKIQTVMVTTFTLGSPFDP